MRRMPKLSVDEVIVYLTSLDDGPPVEQCLHSPTLVNRPWFSQARTRPRGDNLDAGFGAIWQWVLVQRQLLIGVKPPESSKPFLSVGYNPHFVACAFGLLQAIPKLPKLRTPTLLEARSLRDKQQRFMDQLSMFAFPSNPSFTNSFRQFWERFSSRYFPSNLITIHRTVLGLEVGEPIPQQPRPRRQAPRPRRPRAAPRPTTAADPPVAVPVHPRADPVPAPTETPTTAPAAEPSQPRLGKRKIDFPAKVTLLES